MNLTPTSRAVLALAVAMLSVILLIVGCGWLTGVQMPLWLGGAVGGWIGYGVTRTIPVGGVCVRRLTFGIVVSAVAWPLVRPADDHC